MLLIALYMLFGLGTLGHAFIANDDVPRPSALDYFLHLAFWPIILLACASGMLLMLLADACDAVAGVCDRITGRA